MSIYGNQVGNFVITINDQNRYNLSLSESNTFNNSFTRLSADGLKEMAEATYGAIPDNLNQVDGSHNDTEYNTYLAYTFYLKNTSSIPISYYSQMSITKVTKNVDSAIRVMVIKNNDEPVIYAKWKEYPEPEEVWNLPEDHTGIYDYYGKLIPKQYRTTSFESTVTVFNLLTQDMAVQAIDKYTVVIWIEGMDAQCTNNEDNNIMGGTIKFDLEFSVA
jgi:hypothetical protein